MHISPTEAIKLYDVSKPTLYSDMKDGKLSFKIDDRKRRKIDIAELDRLYEKREEDVSSSALNNVKVRQEDTEFNVKNETVEFVRLQEKVEYLERELRASKEQTDKWQEAYEKAQATADKITALIEDRYSSRSNDDEHKKEMDKLKYTVRQLKSQLQAHDEMSFWSRLFGKKPKRAKAS